MHANTRTKMSQPQSFTVGIEERCAVPRKTTQDGAHEWRRL